MLLRLREGADTHALAASAREGLGKLAEELAGMTAVAVYENQVDREDNYDLMAVLSLTGREVLQRYLSHPRHREFIALAGPWVERKASFDC